jgi:NAD(P)-dependent dehydrogenase (short-subunit alcohol dehydrogenase family)
MGRLAGKTAIVTGGARGIGRAIVEKFVEEGAFVLFVDRDETPGRDTERELHERFSDVRFVRGDVTSERDIQQATEQLAAQRGAIDILVNNAGVNAYYDAAAMTEAEWDQVFAVDLKSAWLCAKHALRAMTGARRGSIVNIASIHSIQTLRGTFPYAAAKSGLVGLTRSLALDYGPYNIRVNAILPGYTRTRLVEEWLSTQPDPAEAERVVLAVHPMGRIATPGEIANFVAFVASDEASAITGAALSIDCGLSARFAS